MSANRKIVMVSGSGDYTGACKMAHLYGCALREAGWEVSFITGDRPEDDATCIADELMGDGFDVSEETGFHRLRDGALIDRVEGIFREKRPDVVVSFVQADLKIVGPAARRTKTPYVVSDQIVHKFYGPAPLRWVKRLVFAREMQQAAGIIATSATVGDQAVKEFKCRREKVVIVPNGVDTSGFLPPLPPPADLPARREGTIRLLNVGRLDPQKGQLVLVQAVAQCVQQGVSCDLLLAGGTTVKHPESEEYAEKIRKLVAQLDLSDRIHFLGWRRDIAALHRGSDLYVHSALWEGFPLAPVEAMASGLPVIQTDCVGWPTGFEQRVQGMVVRAGDPAELTEAIAWAARLPEEERRQAGERARQLAQSQYDITVTGKRFADACEKFGGVNGSLSPAVS